jgi:hypothetical protein
MLASWAWTVDKGRGGELETSQAAAPQAQRPEACETVGRGAHVGDILEGSEQMESSRPASGMMMLVRVGEAEKRRRCRGFHRWVVHEAAVCHFRVVLPARVRVRPSPHF